MAETPAGPRRRCKENVRMIKSWQTGELNSYKRWDGAITPSSFDSARDRKLDQDRMDFAVLNRKYERKKV